MATTHLSIIFLLKLLSSLLSGLLAPQSSQSDSPAHTLSLNKVLGNLTSKQLSAPDLTPPPRGPRALSRSYSPPQRELRGFPPAHLRLCCPFRRERPHLPFPPPAPVKVLILPANPSSSHLFAASPDSPSTHTLAYKVPPPRTSVGTLRHSCTPYERLLRLCKCFRPQMGLVHLRPHSPTGGAPRLPLGGWSGLGDQ